MILRPCLDCGNLIPKGNPRCPACLAKRGQQGSVIPGRTGAAWRRLRAQVMAEETRCHLCGLHVDPTLPGLHRMGPVIDHVVPIAHGGHPNDRNNLRLAHRSCNGAKAARLKEEW